MSNATFNAIVMRYSDKDGHVKFNDFVAAYIKLKTLFGKISVSVFDQQSVKYISVCKSTDSTMTECLKCEK